MKTASGVTAPYGWQEEGLCHLLKMTNRRLGIAPAPIFLCQPTGGGKSRVHDTFTITQGGIIWCITPLLSLSADQKSTRRLLKMTIWFWRFIWTISLQIANEQASANGSTNFLRDHIVLTAGLRLSHGIPPGSSKKPSDEDKLQSLCIDEVHRFVQFGLFF
jgi:superfamily II DNA helicase RecQ